MSRGKITNNWKQQIIVLSHILNVEWDDDQFEKISRVVKRHHFQVYKRNGISENFENVLIKKVTKFSFISKFLWKQCNFRFWWLEVNNTQGYFPTFYLLFTLLLNYTCTNFCYCFSNKLYNRKYICNKIKII